jgi:hypothetical protein
MIAGIAAGVCAHLTFSQIQIRGSWSAILLGLDTSYFGAILTRRHSMRFCRVCQHVLPGTMFPGNSPHVHAREYFNSWYISANNKAQLAFAWARKVESVELFHAQ